MWMAGPIKSSSFGIRGKQDSGLSKSSSTGHRAPRAAWRSQEAQERPPSFFIGEGRRTTKGSKSGGRCPHGTRGRNGQQKSSWMHQRKCFEHVIRAVGDFKGMDENVERMQAEIWQRELESIAKKNEEQVPLRPLGLRCLFNNNFCMQTENLQL